jgi:hypothetical protein
MLNESKWRVYGSSMNLHISRSFILFFSIFFVLFALHFQWICICTLVVHVVDKGRERERNETNNIELVHSHRTTNIKFSSLFFSDEIFTSINNRSHF